MKHIDPEEIIQSLDQYIGGRNIIYGTMKTTNASNTPAVLHTLKFRFHAREFHVNKLNAVFS